MSVRDCVQCQAPKKDGSQCSRRTCKSKDFCWQHLKTYRGLRIKPSQISNSGDGLYTTVDIKKGQRIGFYDGKKMSHAAYKANPSGYGLTLDRKTIVDAKSTQSGPMRYINHCRTTNKRSGQCKGNNAKYAPNHRKKRISVKATKKIKAGEEIFASYGRNYWR